MKVHAGSPEWAEKNRNNLVPNKEQKDQNSPDKSGDLPLTPRSGETKGVLTSGKRSTEEALGEEQRPHWPASPTLCKGMGGEGPSGSSSAAPSASRMLRKRKRSEPLLQPLPPLLWDPGELPPPAKLPRLASDRNLGPLHSTLQSKKTLEDRTEGAADSSATQPAPSVSAPGSALADALPLATETGRDSATISGREAADSSSQPVLHGDKDIEMDTTPPGFGATILPSDDDDIEMDTTPPCYAATIISSPNCDSRFMPVYQIQYSVEHRRPAVAPPAHLQ